MNDAAIVTHIDLRRLAGLAGSAAFHAADADVLQDLLAELEAAEAVESDDVAADVVTLDSRLVVRDLDAGRSLAITVVTPDRADPFAGRISVLAPLGLAVLGRRAGQEVRWSSPFGPRRMRIERVTYQPESAKRRRPRAKASS